MDQFGYVVEGVARVSEEMEKVKFKYAEGAKSAALLTKESAEMFRAVTKQLNVFGGVVGYYDSATQMGEDIKNKNIGIPQVESYRPQVLGHEVKRSLLTGGRS